MKRRIRLVVNVIKLELFLDVARAPQAVEMKMDRLVASFPKNKFEEVRVSVKEFKGYDLLDIRVYAATKDGEVKVPTGKGISINVTHFMELKNAFLEAEKILRENDLLHE